MIHKAMETNDKYYYDHIHLNQELAPFAFKLVIETFGEKHATHKR